MGIEQKPGLPKPEQDPNYLAYQAFLLSEAASQLDPNSWLAFSDGELIAQGQNLEEIFQKLKNNEDGPTMVTQVKPEPLHGFFVDKDGGLHRGVPVVGSDENGNETTFGLEWGTMTAYPLSDDDEK